MRLIPEQLESHRRWLLWGIAVLTSLTTSVAVAQTSLPPPGIDIQQNLGQQVPLDLKFRDHNGQEVAIGDYFGEKPVIFTPVYFNCPMLCGLELNALVRCLRASSVSAEKDFEIVTFSIDPNEKPSLASQKRKQYLAQYGRKGTEDGWHFLTGEQEQIEKLCESLGFTYVFDDTTGHYSHAAGIMVCTPEGQISRYLLGVEFAPRDLRLAVIESSNGTIGTLADHVMLLCYAYDPTSGKYGMAIINLLRAGGILTVIALGTGIGWLLRREHLAKDATVLTGGPHE